MDAGFEGKHHESTPASSHQPATGEAKPFDTESVNPEGTLPESAVGRRETREQRDREYRDAIFTRNVIYLNSKNRT